MLKHFGQFFIEISFIEKPHFSENLHFGRKIKKFLYRENQHEIMSTITFRNWGQAYLLKFL